jgi:hypothetical protein
MFSLPLLRPDFAIESVHRFLYEDHKSANLVAVIWTQFLFDKFS